MKPRSSKEHTVGGHLSYPNCTANNRSIRSLNDFAINTKASRGVRRTFRDADKKFARRRRVAKPRNRLSLELVCPHGVDTRVFHIQRKHFRVLLSERGVSQRRVPLFNAKYDVNDSGDLNIANNISKNPRTVLKLVQVGE
jgi:hypothetical protein